MNLDNQFSYLEKPSPENLEAARQEEKNNLSLSPQNRRVEFDDQEIASPVRTFKHVDFYTISYDNAQNGEEEPMLFPFGGDTNQYQDHSKNRSGSQITNRNFDSNLRKRILNILDTTTQETFNNHCQKYSIKTFLRSQQAMNNEIYYDIVESENVDKSIAKFTEDLVENRKADLLETPEEDDRVSHSFSLNHVCSSARNSKGRPTISFNDWLNQSKAR